MTSGNMIVSKILPTGPMQEVKPPENKAEPMPMTTAEAIPDKRYKLQNLIDGKHCKT